MRDRRDIVVEVSGLRIQFAPPSGPVAADGIDLRLGTGRTTALVGESGSGKTATALALMRLIPQRIACVSADRIAFVDQPGQSPVDLMTLDEKAMQRVRGGGITMIFQDPACAM